MASPPSYTIITPDGKGSWYSVMPALDATPPYVLVDTGGGFTWPSGNPPTPKTPYWNYDVFVPEGVTDKAVRITHASLIVQGHQTKGHGFCNLVVESPKYSNHWKVLLWCEDGDSPVHIEFTDPIPMLPDDRICFQNSWSAQPSGPSWRFGLNTYCRAFGAYLQYSIDP